MNVFKYKKGKY